MAGPSSSGSSSSTTSPVTPATTSAGGSSRRSQYRIDVQLLSARSSVAEHRSSYISAAGSTASTSFSGVGAITGRFLHSLGGRTVHGIEYLIKIRPALKRHKDALLGKRNATLNEADMTEIVDDLLEISRAEYLRTYRKQAFEILIVCGGKELWLRLDSVSRRSVRTGLLDLCTTSMLSTSDEQFAHNLLEKCVEWDLQIGNEDLWHDQTDIQMFSSDLREYACRSRKDWAYGLLHDILLQTSLSQNYTEEQRKNLCLELLDMSIQERRMARMTWAVESLLNFLHLPGWDECLMRLDMEVLCSSLFALAEKDDSRAGEKRAWALYLLWEFARLPSWQSSKSAIFPAVKWREIVVWMLKVIRETPRDQQKRAFETLTEFLELDAVAIGDPLHKTEKQQICKELLAFSKKANSSKEKQWAFSLMVELMCLRTWDRLTVKVHRVSNQDRARSSAASPWRSRSQQSADIFQSLADVGMRKRSDTNMSRPSLGSGGSSSGNVVSSDSASSLADDFVYIHVTPAGSRNETYNVDSAGVSPLWSRSVAKAGKPPIRLYASSWEDLDSIDESFEIEPVRYYEKGLPHVILEMRITESPASLRETSSLPPLSPASTNSGLLPRTIQTLRNADSSGSLQVPSALPPGSPVTPVSSISSSPPRIVYSHELRGSPSSFLSTQSLPSTSLVIPPSPTSPRVESPSSSESGHSRMYHWSPHSPAPAAPLPPVPGHHEQYGHRRGGSVESSPRPPPRSPLPPTPPERSISESQAPPSAFSRPYPYVRSQIRPATAPQTTFRQTERRQRFLPSVREESRTRPREDSFLDIG